MKHPEQVAQAVRLRTAGHSNRAISRELGVSPPTIHRWLAAADKAADAAAAVAAPVVAAVRDHRAEIHRLLDQVIEANISRAETPGNANVVLRAVEVRGRLEGLVAPPAAGSAGSWSYAQMVVQLGHSGPLLANPEDLDPNRPVIPLDSNVLGVPVATLNNYDNVPRDPTKVQHWQQTAPPPPEALQELNGRQS